MAAPFFPNTIERLGRALLAQLASATGERAVGTITVAALAGVGDPLELPANTYMMPVVDGQLRDDLLFKTANAWTVARGATESGVGIKSNVGGARHNLPAGTLFRFNPPIEGFAATATLDASMTSGSNEGQLIRSVAVYEELDSANPDNDLFAAKVGDRGVMLIWSQSEPVEGAMGGLRQGANRATRSSRFWRESFVIYVVVSRLTGDSARRQDGQMLMATVTGLLTDRMQNDDGEQLSSVGSGVEITHRARLGRSANHYIYGVQLRVNQTLEARIDARTFAPWLRTNYTGALPGRDAPEPIQDLEVVDATDPMP
jgi:hypothetical protein